MKVRRTASLLVVAGLVALGVVAPAPDASGVPVATVTSVSVDPGPFAVDGVRVTQVAEISAHIVEPAAGGVGAAFGFSEDCHEDGATATFTRAGDGTGVGQVRVQLHELMAGTANDGTWSGWWQIGATRGGTWTLTSVAWCRAGGDWVSIDPRVSTGTTATVVVNATHAPTVSQFRIPAVVAYGARQWNQFIYRDGYGNRLARWPVRYGAHDYCGETHWIGSKDLVTDSGGRLTVRTSTGTSTSSRQCVYFLLDVNSLFDSPYYAVILQQDWLSRSSYYKAVGFRVSSAVVDAGAPLTITGSAYPRTGTMRLQRLVGRTWRTLAAQQIDPSTSLAKFTWHFGAKGPVYLRVVAGPATVGTAQLVTTPSNTARILVVR